MPLISNMPRLATLAGIAALWLLGVSSACAQAEPAFPLRGESGEPMQNFRIPSELDPASLPGVIWAGPRDGDVVIYEFFDYNCAYCRKAAGALADIAAHDPHLRIGLVNDAGLSVGSVQAAKVQQGVFRLFGPAKAYEFHLKLYEARGAASGAAALAVVRAMGLDADKVTESADSETVSQVLTKQARLAEALGVNVTPAFIVAGTAILGWPGAAAMHEIIANARKCDQPVCDRK